MISSDALVAYIRRVLPDAQVFEGMKRGRESFLHRTCFRVVKGPE